MHKGLSEVFSIFQKAEDLPLITEKTDTLALYMADTPISDSRQATGLCLPPSQKKKKETSGSFCIWQTARG